MAISVVRLGKPRLRREGPRLGTVRQPPRGVRKCDYAARDYFDLWLPELAPSAKWVSWALAEPFSDSAGRGMKRITVAKWRDPSHADFWTLLALLSQQTNFSVGCYCADESHCHRSLLRELLIAAGAKMAK